MLLLADLAFRTIIETRARMSSVIAGRQMAASVFIAYRPRGAAFSCEYTRAFAWCKKDAADTLLSRLVTHRR
jgi:hypothetical protein